MAEGSPRPGRLRGATTVMVVVAAAVVTCAFPPLVLLIVPALGFWFAAAAQRWSLVSQVLALAGVVSGAALGAWALTPAYEADMECGLPMFGAVLVGAPLGAVIGGVVGRVLGRALDRGSVGPADPPAKLRGGWIDREL